MKKLIAVILLFALAISLTGCRGKLVKTETKEVEAIIVAAYYNRYGSYIKVEYDGAKNELHNSDLYNKYKNRLGETIGCYLIIRTYENGDVTKQLVYNSELNN